MPADLTSIATYVGAFIFVIALIAVGAWLLKGMMARGGNKSASFLRGRERRLGVVEAANVDGRRKLVLVRRDNVEHLIMTGGPVDVLVESGIQATPVEEQSSHQEQSTYQESTSYQPERNDDRVVIAHDEQHRSPGTNEHKD